MLGACRSICSAVNIEGPSPTFRASPSMCQFRMTNVRFEMSRARHGRRSRPCLAPTIIMAMLSS
jgi:hypothetical protein